MTEQVNTTTNSDEELTPEEEARLNEVHEEVERLRREAEQLYLKRKRINKRNKDRSRAMETRIAHLLDGSRVPSSGAGALKGDVVAPSPLGDFLVECKLSQREDRNGIQHFTLELPWLTKIRKEARESKPRRAFGVVVFRYHDVRRGDYAVMYLTDLLRLPRQSFTQRPEHTVDVQKKSLDFALPTLDSAWRASYTDAMNPSEAICLWSDDMYVIMRFDAFQELVHVEPTEE